MEEVRFEDLLFERHIGRTQHLGQGSLLVPQRLLCHLKTAALKLFDLTMKRHVVDDFRGGHRNRENQ